VGARDSERTAARAQHFAARALRIESGAAEVLCLRRAQRRRIHVRAPPGLRVKG